MREFVIMLLVDACRLEEALAYAEMVKSFLGIALKTGGQIILSIYLIENIIIYTIVAIRSNSRVGDYNHEFFDVPIVNRKIGKECTAIILITFC
jgi:hypothetical protein